MAGWARSKRWRRRLIVRLVPRLQNWQFLNLPITSKLIFQPFLKKIRKKWRDFLNMWEGSIFNIWTMGREEKCIVWSFGIFILSEKMDLTERSGRLALFMRKR